MECRCYCCVTPRWVWLCPCVPVRNTSASQSCAWHPISSSKFASPSRSLGREFNLISPQSRGRQREQHAPSRRMPCLQPGRTQGSARHGCGRLGTRTILFIALLLTPCPVCADMGVRSHLAQSPAASQGTPLPTRPRPRSHFVGFSTNTVCLCCFENDKALFSCRNRGVSHCVKVHRFLHLSWGVGARRKCGNSLRPGDRSYRANSRLFRFKQNRGPKVAPGTASGGICTLRMSHNLDINSMLQPQLQLQSMSGLLLSTVLLRTCSPFYPQELPLETSLWFKIQAETLFGSNLSEDFEAPLHYTMGPVKLNQLVFATGLSAQQRAPYHGRENLLHMIPY